MMSTIKGNVLLARHIAPNSYAPGEVTGEAFDLAGFTNVTFFIDVGDVGAAGTLDAKLQYSDDGANWTDEDGAGGNDTAIAQIAAAGTAALHVPNPKARYYHVAATVGGNNVAFAVTAAAGGARHRPV